MTKRQQVKATKPEPHVGIFWLVNGKLLIDSTPVSQSESYGEYRTHPRSHIDVWAQYQQNCKALRDTEYEEYPRGRVTHRPVSGEFTILADRCILERRDVLSQIRLALHLADETKSDADPHYRCFRCLYPNEEGDE